mgnify:FL=1
MKKKQVKTFLYVAITLLVISIFFYIFKEIPKPDQFVVDYLSIAEKAKKQKPFLKDELINSDLIFGKFNEEIKYFSKQKYIIEKAEFNVYELQKRFESTDAFARIYFNVKYYL